MAKNHGLDLTQGNPLPQLIRFAIPLVLGTVFQQLCAEVEPDPETMASHLENTTVVIAPLIPWSIAGAVPLATVGAPTACILTACYLYLLPVWNYLVAIRNHHKKA